MQIAHPHTCTGDAIRCSHCALDFYTGLLAFARAERLAHARRLDVIHAAALQYTRDNRPTRTRAQWTPERRAKLSRSMTAAHARRKRETLAHAS